MVSAISQLTVMDLAFLGTFAGQLLNTLKFLTLMLTAINLLLQGIGSFGILVQVVVELLLEKVSDEKPNALPFRSNG